jgi:hypothetical protein
MQSTQNLMELTQSELTVLETALQTQVKILSVGAHAGAENAEDRLNEVKRVLARITPLRKPAAEPKSVVLGWFQRHLGMGKPMRPCPARAK